jgi:hypothetical protein
VTTTDLFYDGSNVIQENQTPGFSASPVQTQYVWSPVLQGQMILRDDNDGLGVPNQSGNYGNPASALDRRVWPTQGPDGSTWTVQEQYTGIDKPFYHEEFIYTPSGETISIDYNSGTQQYDFFTTSEFDFRYGWKGGRAGRDQATGLTNDPTNPNTYTDQYNGTYLMPDGSVYDAATGTQAPMNSDKYAFFRTTTANNGLNQYQYGTRSWVNVVAGENGTTSNLQDLQLHNDLLNLQSGIENVLNPFADIAESAGNVFAGIGSTIAHPIQSYNSAVSATANFISQGMIDRQRMGYGAAGNYALSAWEGAGYIVGSAIGARQLGEAAYGVSLQTNQELTSLERWTLAFQGIGALSFTAAGLVGGYNPALQSFQPGGAGFDWLLGGGGASTSPAEAIGGCFPAGTPVMLVADAEQPEAASVWMARLRYWAIGAGISAAALAGWFVLNGKPARGRQKDDPPPEEFEPPEMPLPASHGGWASFFCKCRITW